MQKRRAHCLGDSTERAIPTTSGRNLHTPIPKGGDIDWITLQAPPTGPILSMSTRGTSHRRMGGLSPGAEWRKWTGRVASTSRTTPRQRIQRKRFLDELAGDTVDSLWDDIAPINSQAKERLGYPTQKPEALLERVIQASTSEG